MDALAQQYYAHLTKGFGVRVVDVPGKGKGLVATKAFKADEVLFMEAPLGSLQHASNKPLVRACDHCCAFIGTLTDHFNRLATVEAPADGVALPQEVVEEVAAGFEADFPPLPDDWAPPGIDAADAVLSEVVPCAHGCAAEYCSAACRDAAARQYHVLLCPAFEPPGAAAAGGGAGASSSAAAAMDADDGGDGDDDGHAVGDVNAAVLFQHQATQTNEIFLLAARLLGRVLEAWARNGNDLNLALAQCAVLHAEPWPALFARTAKGAGGGDGAGDEPTTGLQARVTEWMRDSLTILRSLVRERLPHFVDAVEAGVAEAEATAARKKALAPGCGHAHAAGESCSSSAATAADGAAAAPAARPRSLRQLRDWEFDGLLSEETYARLIGAFELNNIEVKIPSPLADYVGSLQALPTKGGLRSPFQRAMAVIEPVLAQIDAAKGARKALRRRLRKLEAQFAEEDEEDDGGEGHGHAHGGHGHAHGDMQLDDDAGGSNDGDESDDDDESGSDEEDDDYEDAADGAAAAAREEGYEKPEGDDDTELDPAKLLPHANGTALFALGCTMNHSCSPNVQVMYGSRHYAAVTARRPIAAGEELCINYVALDGDLAQRRRDLRHYGFVCACERCVAEAAR